MSRVARYLAERFRTSKAGRTGAAVRNPSVVFKNLLQAIDCRHGPERYAAVRELEQLEALGIVRLERHRRDLSAILKVHLLRDRTEALFAQLGETAPQEERAALARLFREAGAVSVPANHTHGWTTFCASLADAALDGGSLYPFDRSNPDQTREILAVLPAILAWEGESYLRFASSLLFGDSKRLETLRPRIEGCLRLVTAGTSPALADFGIVENDRSLLLHGPLTLRFGAEELNLDLLRAPVRISAPDMASAVVLSRSTRCLTVENAAMLHELAKQRSGVLLAGSGSEGGFANSAVIAFLKTLPAAIELWHFGDSDPKGFEILADLRLRAGRKIQSLHMRFHPTAAPTPALTAEDEKTIDRLLGADLLPPEEKQQLRNMRSAGTKGRFEQEAFGRPGSQWPFY